MSTRKTRKEKIKRDKRRAEYQRQLKELNRIKAQLEAKVSADRKEVFKKFHIRNLRIFRDTCNFLLPFVVCAGISVGGLYALEGGLPVKKDDLTRNKRVYFSVDTPEEKTYLKEEYAYTGIFSNGEASSKITIVSPWEKRDDYYVRFTREYSISKNKKEIIQAILQKDYSTLVDLLSNYTEIEETTNHPTSLDEEYIIKGNIIFIDEEDKITFPESTAKNIIITLVEVAFTLLVGGVVAHNRYFSYIDALETDQRNYRVCLRAYKKHQEELEETNGKILALTRGGNN